MAKIPQQTASANKEIIRKTLLFLKNVDTARQSKKRIITALNMK